MLNEFDNRPEACLKEEVVWKSEAHAYPLREFGRDSFASRSPHDPRQVIVAYAHQAGQPTHG